MGSAGRQRRGCLQDPDTPWILTGCFTITQMSLSSQEELGLACPAFWETSENASNTGKWQNVVKKSVLDSCTLKQSPRTVGFV